MTPLKVLAALLSVLSTCALSATKASAQAPMPEPDHGIVLFYGEETDPGTLKVETPSIYGGEYICWWGDIEKEEGVYDWSPVDAQLEFWRKRGKKLDVRLGTAHNRPNNTPAWLYNKYKVRRIANGSWLDIEEMETSHFTLPNREVLIGDAAAVITGEHSLVVKHEGQDPTAFLEYGEKPRLDPQSRYSVQFDYAVQEPGEYWVQLVSLDDEEVGQRMVFATSRTTPLTFNWEFDTPDAQDLRLQWGTSGPGRVSVDNLLVMKIDKELLPHMTTFEEREAYGPWIIHEDASRSALEDHVLEDEWSLYAKNETEDFMQVLTNDSELLPFETGRGYQTMGWFKGITTATVRYRLYSDVEPATVLEEKVMDLDAGQKVWLDFFYPHQIWRPETRVEIGIVGPGEIAIDEFGYRIWSDRLTTFPNYFDPVFREKWEAFVTAFAKRYNGQPGVGVISVGGFGRWEEVILDLHEAGHGLLDRQWLAHGFTEQKYIDHVGWVMDMYRRVLPDQPLRICLAFGLDHQNNVNWIYRRIAQMAIERGIGLKQNGMTESYDIWGDQTDTSYLYHKYRFDPKVHTTHETAAQIVFNGSGVTGHPVSLLNRTLANYTDYIFLYSVDVDGRNVRKYHHYFTEQMGRSLFTSFYNRLGSFPLVHEPSPFPVNYNNQWMGMRQVQTADANVVFTQIDGEPCAKIQPDEPRLAFDVDDRFQYNGIYGVVLYVDYLDAGKEPLTVRVNDTRYGTWRTLGVIEKHDSGKWKVAAFSGSDWCRSPRAAFEDVHIDVTVETSGVEPEYIRQVSMRFVPARDWQTENIIEETTVAEFTPLDASITRTFELPRHTAVVHGVQIPLHVAEPNPAECSIKVYGITEEGEVLLAEKRNYAPRDGDWWRIPLQYATGVTNLRMVLTPMEGEVGWYRNADDKPALRVERYVYETVESKSPGVWQPIAPGASHTLEFEVKKPFTALGLQARAASQTDADVTLRRVEPDGLSEPLPCARSVTIGGKDAPVMHAEPQPAGVYQLEITAKSAALEVGAHSASAVLPHTLLRRQSPRAAVQPETGDMFTSWDLTLPRGGRQNWRIRGDARKRAMNTEDGLRLDFTEYSGNIEADLATATSPTLHHVAFNLVNETDCQMLRVWWTNGKNEFSPENSAFIPVVSNDPVRRTYCFPLGLETNYGEGVAKLRLEPAAIATAGTMTFSDMRMTRKEP